jgi:hypothetical protein
MNIHNVFGCTRHDFLTGSASSKVMDGGAGFDTMSGLGEKTELWPAITMLTFLMEVRGYLNSVKEPLQQGLESNMDSCKSINDGTFKAFRNTFGTASSTLPRIVGDTSVSSIYRCKQILGSSD